MACFKVHIWKTRLFFSNHKITVTSKLTFVSIVLELMRWKHTRGHVGLQIIIKQKEKFQVLFLLKISVANYFISFWNKA